MKSEIYKRIPNLLRKYRRISGFSQKQVGLLLGYKNGNRISRWENSDELPSALNIFRLSVAYRVLIDSLFIDHIHTVRKEIHAREQKLFPDRRQRGNAKSNYS